MKYTAILSLPLIQVRQLSVTGERMCTKYWLTAQEACPGTVRLGKLTGNPYVTKVPGYLKAHGPFSQKS